MLLTCFKAFAYIDIHYQLKSAHISIDSFTVIECYILQVPIHV